MRNFWAGVVGALWVLTMAATSHARITAEDVQAIAEATANTIDAQGVQCNGGGTVVVDPAGPTVATPAPTTFQACKMKRDGECKPTRTFLKAVE